MDTEDPESSSLCPLCDNLLDEVEKVVVVVKTKGVKTFIERSKLYNDSKWKRWENASELECHEVCRKKYGKGPILKSPRSDRISTISQRTAQSVSISSLAKRAPSPLPSSSQPLRCAFDFKSLCFYCGLPCDERRRRHLMRLVQDKSLIERLNNKAKGLDNFMGREVLARLGGVSCLVQEEARYHIKCSNTFFSMAKPERPPSARSALIKASFDAICEYIETSGKFEFTLKELQARSPQYSLTTKALYEKLRTKYGTDIFIPYVRGKSGVIYYKYFDIGEIYKKFYRGENLLEPEKLAIFKVAAELLRKDIKNREYKTDSYPPIADFLTNADEDVPDSLLDFLELLFDNENSENPDRHKIKSSCLAHSIIKSIRGAAFVSSLQLGLGTYIYRKTGSKQIIDILNKTGVCSSYHHLLQFENSSSLNPPAMAIGDGVHVQHVFTNTDYNVCTSEGTQTFHCLGGIAVYTPENLVTYEGRTTKVTKRNSETCTAALNKNGIKTIPYLYSNQRGLESLNFVDTNTLNISPLSLPPSYSVYLWSKAFAISNVPSWSSFMEVMSNDGFSLKSRVVCLPFINESPSKPTTLNTALHHAQAEANKIHQQTCYVTFDQPLFRRARAIVAESQKHGQLRNVVVRLGGFHLLKSYLCAVGYIMGGTGLDSLWSHVYASRSAKKMLLCREFARTMRAHVLTFTALGVMIGETIKNDKTEEFRNFLTSFVVKWQDGNPDTPLINECTSNPIIAEMTDEFIRQINILKNNGPTAQLWLQYFRLIDIALQFIEAERLGNWKLHLRSVKEMLPVFHAAGHVSYAKSAQIYLQDMSRLETEVGDDAGYEMFAHEGYFTVRRSDKTWSGVWSDMTIEQTLNRFFGTDLKHGKALTPEVMSRYLLAVPTVLSVMASVEEYFDMATSSAQQNKDVTATRLKRDDADLAKFLLWLRKHAPLDRRPNLISLSTEIIGGPEVNCHLAIEIGRELMRTMVGQNPENVVLSVANRVTTLESARNGANLGGTSRMPVNSVQLFNRLSAVFKGDEEKRRKAFEYELSPFPLALFDEKGYMRRTERFESHKVFKTHKLPKGVRSLEEFMMNFVLIIDGGFLLHRVNWPQGVTYRSILESYRLHIMENFRGSACIVFDDYNNVSRGIKSYEPYPRNENNYAPDVDVSPDNFVTLSQQNFLSNTSNKVKFVRLLSEYLINSGIQVSLAEDDADVLIAKTALEISGLVPNSPVAIVGDNVNLFVLLLGLGNERQRIYYYRIDPTAKTNGLYASEDYDRLREFILFAHAFGGCDTTSAIYSVDKKKIIELLEHNQFLRENCRVFYDPYSREEGIFNAAEVFISYLYGFANEQMTMGAARYRKYEDSAFLDATLRLSSLPPTAGALREHAKRVYLQIQTWLGNKLEPETWGWNRSDANLLPIMTKDNPAPEEFSTTISCGCTNDCTGSRCKCKKSGVDCSSLCKGCNGINCQNSRFVDIDGNFEEAFEDSDGEADDGCNVESNRFGTTEIGYENW